MINAEKTPDTHTSTPALIERMFLENKVLLPRFERNK